MIFGGVVLLGAAAFTAKSDGGGVEVSAASNGTAPAHSSNGDDAEPEVSDEKECFRDCNENSVTGMETDGVYGPLGGS